jgi:hypothetical protein
MIFRLEAVPESTVRRYFLQVPALLNLRFPGLRMPVGSTVTKLITPGSVLSAHRGPGIFFHGGTFFFGAFLSSLCWKGSPGPKNGTERCVSQFYTICDKIQFLNINIEKVTAFFVLRSWDAVPQARRINRSRAISWRLVYSSREFLRVPTVRGALSCSKF